MGAATCACAGDDACRQCENAADAGVVDLPTVDWSSFLADESDQEEEGLPVTPRGLIILPPSDETHNIAWHDLEEPWPSRSQPLLALPGRHRVAESDKADHGTACPEAKGPAVWEEVDEDQLHALSNSQTRSELGSQSAPQSQEPTPRSADPSEGTMSCGNEVPTKYLGAAINGSS
ncbi:unnamed protein product [Effrenium voratum]|uniref:Uncharacterized protein n=1 Tax=Effrenium voratum TaxID=2562239 RepID=A0AA36MWE5_9DINO|nr:unnamed protein product [Effrenium voratum]